MSDLLVIESAAVDYGGIRAVKDVSLRVPEGGAACLIGSNGAGKSSLARSVVGWQSLSGGKVTFDGNDITGWSADRISRAGLVLIAEDRRIFGPLTVHENLLVPSGHSRTKADNVDRALDVFPALKQFLGVAAGALSGGQQQMLAIARALIMDPKLLVLDEPSLGLAPLIIEDVYAALTGIMRNGQSVLLIEQNSRLALSHTNYAYVMNQGRISFEGSSTQLAADPELFKRYL